MARARRSKNSNKHYPVQRKMRLRETASPQTNDTQMQILVDKQLSAINHRLYRQSRIYSCKVEIDASLPTGAFVDVYALSDTWMNMKAYQYAKKQYDKNSNEEMSAIAQSNVGRWNDFRVGLAATTARADMNAIVSSAAAETALTSGKYLLSEVTDAAGVTHEFAWLESDSNTFNIIDEYDRTGDTQQTPTFEQSTVAYADLDDQIDSDQVEHLTGQGDEPPYDDRNLENACLSRVARLYVDNEGQGKLSTAYFNAPCGIIYCVGGGGMTSITLSDSLCVEVKAGDYKGVHAPNMLE